MRRRARWTILVAILAGVQFCTLLGRSDITASHEGRVAQTAREMLETGDWIVPHLAGRLRLQKPPLPYWCAAALWKISGTLDVALARFPAALCGALATLIMFDLARRFFGRNGGLLCALVWLSTYFIADEFRKAMADPYLAFFTLLAIWSWICAERNTAFVLLFGVALAFGVLAKGPFVFLHAAIGIATYHVVFRRRPRWTKAHLASFALFLAIAAPWPILVAMKVPNIAEVWMRESLGQAAGARNAQPFYYYLPSLLQTTAPWTVVAMIGAAWPFVRKTKRDRLLLWPLAWLAITILLFSLSPQKKNAYLLPVMPAQTMLIAAPLALSIRAAQTRAARLVVTGHAIAAAVALIVVFALIWKAAATNHRVDYFAAIAAALGVAASVTAIRSSSAPSTRAAWAATAITFAIAIYGIVGWLRPAHENRRSPVPFVMAMNGAVGDARVASVGFIAEDVLFYIRRPIETFDRVGDLPGDFSGFVLVADESREALQEVRPMSAIIATTQNRRKSDQTFLIRVAPAMARR